MKLHRAWAEPEVKPLSYDEGTTVDLLLGESFTQATGKRKQEVRKPSDLTTEEILLPRAPALAGPAVVVTLNGLVLAGAAAFVFILLVTIVSLSRRVADLEGALTAALRAWAHRGAPTY